MIFGWSNLRLLEVIELLCKVIIICPHVRYGLTLRPNQVKTDTNGVSDFADCISLKPIGRIFLPLSCMELSSSVNCKTSWSYVNLNFFMCERLSGAFEGRWRYFDLQCNGFGLPCTYFITNLFCWKYYFLYAVNLNARLLFWICYHPVRRKSSFVDDISTLEP